MNYQPVKTNRKFPGLTSAAGLESTPDGRYWQKFKNQLLCKEFSSITSISISPNHPHDFALTTSARLQIYSSFSNTLSKSIAKFKDVTLSCDFRSDGKLIAAGDATGLVQIFDTEKKTILRSLEGHSQGTRVVRYHSDKTHILSCSDDQTCRFWDIPTQTCLSVRTEHEDYVRAAVLGTQNTNIFLTGSYDHTVKLWDTRADASASCLTLKHGAPVESVILLPGDAVAISAGRNYFCVWDLLAGGRLLQTVCNHQKTITCMALDKTGSKLLTGSLDQYVKVYDINEEYSVVQGLKYPAPILSMGVSKNDSHVVVGMANGILSIRQRDERDISSSGNSSSIKTAMSQLEHQPPKQPKTQPVGSYGYFNRGIREMGLGKNDLLLDNETGISAKSRSKALKPYDRYLRKFQYKDALDAALEKSSSIVVYAVLEDLISRHALLPAISGRDEQGLLPLLHFLAKNVTNPAYSKLLMAVTEATLNIYGSVLGRSDPIDTLFTKIKHSIREELLFQRRLAELHGIMDMLLTAQTTVVDRN